MRKTKSDYNSILRPYDACHAYARSDEHLKCVPDVSFDITNETHLNLQVNTNKPVNI